jgi:tetratricopeptide (TPR) repeat protein
MAGIRRSLTILVCLAAAAAVFAPCLTAPFLVDDVLSVPGNPSLRTLWPPWSMLAAPWENPLAGRPVVNVSFALNRAVTGLAPWGFHVVNLGLHVLNGWLLFAVVRGSLALPAAPPARLCNADLLALAAAVLWLVHPLNTEVIAYVTQRTEILMATFYLATLLAAIHGWAGGRRWIAAATAACMLGTLCKESMVTAPLAVVLHDLAFSGLRPAAVWRRRRWLYAGLATSWIVLAAVMASGPRSGSVGFGRGISPWDYLLTQGWAVGRYLFLAVWPERLLVDYGDLPRTAVADWLPGGSVVLALVGVATLTWRRSPPLSFAILACLLALGPTSSIVPIVTEVGAERRMYLSLAPLVAGGVCLVDQACGRLVGLGLSRSGAGILLAVILAGWGAGLGTRTWQRSADYLDPVRLWESAVAILPDNARSHSNLAAALVHAGRDDTAEAAARRAIELSDRAVFARATLATILVRQGRAAEALELARAYVSERPSATSWFQLGNLLRRTGDDAAAIRAYEQVLDYDPRHTDALNNLAALVSRTAPAEALPHLQAVLEIDPNHDQAYCNLGNVYLRLGRLAEAERCYRTALQLNPANPQARRGLDGLR